MSEAMPEMMSDAIIELEWVLPESQRDEQVQAIEVAGGTVEDSGASYTPAGDYHHANFEPLLMITAAASIVFVMQAIAKTWRDRKVQGGIVVDARSKKLRIRPVPAMPTGRLVIVDDTGTRIFDKEDENAGKALLADVLARFDKK